MTQRHIIMFRITPQTNDDELVLKLEGSLTGAWVEELDACWRALDRPRLAVDLRDVCYIDAAGRELMRQMYHAGARFVVSGCATRELVREIEESAGASRRQ